MIKTTSQISVDNDMQLDLRYYTMHYITGYFRQMQKTFVEVRIILVRVLQNCGSMAFIVRKHSFIR